MGSKDERIVQMTFDNQQFEKGVAQSRQSLKDLEKSLQLEGATKGFSDISKAADNVDLSAISRGVEALQNRFSFFGIMGMKVMEEIATAAINLGKNLWNMTFGQIKSGGIRRAMNVENAHFMLQGLLKDEQQVQQIMSWAMDSVDGTAYAYDSAAKAASQFAASGVVAEEEMRRALRGITGVAAMTNSEYEDISRIFTTVAGNGRLMGDQLLQLSGRGLNAAATIVEFFNGVNDGSKHASEEVTKYVKDLSKGLNVTESDIREFVSKGKINFGVFSEAMEEAFGEHAKKANETLTGVMANVKAALSKIGADFVQDLIVQNGPLVKFFNALRESINKVRKELGPFSKTFVESVTAMADKATAFFKYIKVEYIIQAMAHGLEMIKQLLKPIGNAFRDVFGETTIFRMNVALNNFKNFIQSLQVSERATKNIHDIFGGFFAVLSIGGQIIKALINQIKPLADILGNIGGKAADAGGSFGQYLMNLNESLKESDFFNKKFTQIRETIGKGVDKIKEKLSQFSGVKDFIKKIFKGIKEAFSSDLDTEQLGKVAGVVDNVKDAFVKFFEVLSKFGTVIKEAFTNFYNSIDKSSVATTFMSGITAALEIAAGVLKIVVDLFTQIATKIKEIAKSGLENFNFSSLIDLLEGGAAVVLITKLGEALGVFARSIDVGSMMSIGKALLMMVGAIAILTLLDQAKVETAIGTITTLMTELVVAYNAMTGLFNKTVRNEGNQGIAGFIGKMTGLSKAFTALSDLLWAGRNLLRAQVLVTLAASVLILAGALALLAQIPKDKLNDALSAITVLIAELVISFKMLSKSIDSSKMAKMGGTMLGFAAGILILSIALERLGNLDPSKLEQGLLGLGGVMLELAVFMRMIKSSSFGASQGAGLILMAAAMEIFYDVIRKFGNMDTGTLAKGIIALGGALMVIALALKMMPSTSSLFKTTDTLSSNQTNFIKIGAALILMGAAMEIFADVIAKLGALPLENIAKGLVGIGGALTACVLALKYIDADGVIKKATALVVLGAAMELFADVLQKMGSMSLGDIAKGLGAIIVSLGAAVIALNALSQGDSVFATNGFFAANSQGSLLKSAASLVIVAASLEIFADALGKVGSMDLSQIGKGLIGLGGGLAAMVAALKLLKNQGLGGAAALMVTAVAIRTLVPAIKQLGSMKLTTIILGLSAIAMAFGALALGAYMVQPVAGILLEASASMLIFGAGLALVGVGLTSIVAALIAFVGLVAATAKSIDIIAQAVTSIVVGVLKGVIDGLDLIIQAVGKWIGQLIDYLGTHGDTIIQAFVTLLRLAADAIVAVIPTILYTLAATVAETLKSLIDSGVLKDICNSLLILLEQALDLLIEHTPELADRILNLLYVLLDTLGEHVDDALDHLIGFLEDFMNGLAEELVKHTDPLLNAVNNIIKGIVYFALSLLQEVLKLIPGVGEAMAEGLEGVKQEIADSMTDSEGRALLKDFGNGMEEELKETRDRLEEKLHWTMDMPEILPEDWKAAQKKSAELFGTEEMAAIVMAMEGKGPEVEAKAKAIIDAPLSAMEEQKALAELLGGDLIEYYAHGMNGHQQAVNDVREEFLAAQAEYDKQMGYQTKEGTETAFRESVATVEELTPQMKGAIYDFFVNPVTSPDMVQAQIDAWKAQGDNGMAAYLEALRNGENLEEARRCAEEICYEGAEAAKDPDVWEESMEANMDGYTGGATTGFDNYIQVSKKLSAKGPLELVRNKNDYKTAGQTNMNEYTAAIASNQIKATIEKAIEGAVMKAVQKILDMNKRFLSGGEQNANQYASGIDSKKGAVENSGASLAKSASEGAASKTGAFKQIGNNSASNYGSGIEGFRSVVKGSATVIAQAGVEGAGSRQDSMRTTGQNAGQGFANGMQDKNSTVYNRAWALAGQALAGMQNRLNINSPSKETMKFGRSMGEGLEVGLESYSTRIKKVSSDFAEESLDALQNGMENVARIANMDMDYAPTITPVLDLTNVTSGIASMNTMFDDSRAVAAKASFDMYQNYSNPDYISQFAKMSSDNEAKMAKIIDKQTDVLLDIRTRLAHQQIVLDSGELVGATINKIDEALGERMVRAGRGN